MQEAFLRYHRALAGGAEIESPKAFLSAVIDPPGDRPPALGPRARETLCRRVAARAAADRPAVPDPAAHAEHADSLSMAFLLLLERLTPAERAVFLLHDVFDLRLRRDRRHRRQVRGQLPPDRGPRPPPRRGAEAALRGPQRERDELAGAVLRRPVRAATSTAGRAAGAQTWSSTATAAARRRSGRLRSSASTVCPACLAGLGRRCGRATASSCERSRGQRAAGGDVPRPGGPGHQRRRDRHRRRPVQAVRSVINPDKLRHLGPVADVWGLVREHRDARRQV